MFFRGINIVCHTTFLALLPVKAFRINKKKSMISIMPSILLMFGGQPGPFRAGKNRALGWSEHFNGEKRKVQKSRY